MISLVAVPLLAATAALSQTTYDYVVGRCLLYHALQAIADNFCLVGGGTAGLTVAVRLSELPDVSVAVLEAGGT